MTGQSMKKSAKRQCVLQTWMDTSGLIVAAVHDGFVQGQQIFPGIAGILAPVGEDKTAVLDMYPVFWTLAFELNN